MTRASLLLFIGMKTFLSIENFDFEIFIELNPNLVLRYNVTRAHFHIMRRSHITVLLVGLHEPNFVWVEIGLTSSNSESSVPFRPLYSQNA